MIDKKWEKKLIKMSAALQDYAEPDKAWVQSTKQVLVSQLEADRPSRVKVPFWLKAADSLVPRNLAVKPTAVFSLVLGLFLISSFATVNAAKNTLPGNPLYNVKIGAERIKYILAVSEEAKARMSMEIAKKRAEELRILAVKIGNKEADDQVRRFSAQQVSIQLKNELNKVKNTLTQIKTKESDAEKAVAVAKDIDKNIQFVKQEIGDSQQIKAKDGLKNDVQEVLTKAQDVELVALALLTEKHQTGEVDLSADNLQKKIRQRAKEAMAKVSELTGNQELEPETKEKLRVIKEIIQQAESLLKKDELVDAVETVKQAEDGLKAIQLGIKGEENKEMPLFGNQDGQTNILLDQKRAEVKGEKDAPTTILDQPTTTDIMVSIPTSSEEQVITEPEEEWVLDSQKEEVSKEEFEVKIVE